MFRVACAQCGAQIVAAVWSEHVNERCVRNVWSCEACGYEFETEAHFEPSNLMSYHNGVSERQRELTD